MPSRTLATLSIVVAGVLAPAAVADAASKKASKYPTIKKISPMSVSIGETLTITGSGYIKGKAKNTVVFRRAGKQALFVKADGLSSSRLSLVVPEKLRNSLGKKSGTSVATRFQIRVLAKRFGKGYTALKSSPTVLPADALPAGTKKAGTTVTPVPAPAPAPAARVEAPAPPPPAPNCDGDAQPDSVDPDDDNDLLADTTEAQIQTNRCLADTDGDGMGDGWEYQSAVDRNQLSCPKAPANTEPSFDYPKPCQAAMPYPSKRPYTNPLVADAHIDFDGDYLSAGNEHRAWKLKGDRTAAYRALTGPNGMWYSDGKQSSVDTAPEDNTCRGMELPSDLPFNGIYNRREFAIETDVPVDPSNPTGPKQVLYPDLDNAGVVKAEYAIYSPSRGDGNACLNDSERDEDGDFLSNSEELNASMSGSDWWSKIFKEPIYDLAYFGESKLLGTDWLDADTDNDGSVDALDDEDADDFLNIEELVRGTPIFMTVNGKTVMTGNLRGLWVDPFNPCLPSINSRSCPIAELAGSPGAWRPFAADPEKPQIPRWPLYGEALYDNIAYEDPTWVDDGDPATLPNSAPTLTGPEELWDPPVAVDQDPNEAPVHPLPR